MALLAVKLSRLRRNGMRSRKLTEDFTDMLSAGKLLDRRANRILKGKRETA